MSQCVLGSTITITVLVTDNSSMFNTPDGTPQPTTVNTIQISLFTPAGTTQVSNAAMTAGSQIGYYGYAYQSSIYDMVGEWAASFYAQSGGSIVYTPKVPIFTMITAG